MRPQLVLSQLRRVLEKKAVEERLVTNADRSRNHPSADQIVQDSEHLNTYVENSSSSRHFACDLEPVRTKEQKQAGQDLEMRTPRTKSPALCYSAPTLRRLASTFDCTSSWRSFCDRSSL